MAEDIERERATHRAMLYLTNELRTCAETKEQAKGYNASAFYAGFECAITKLNKILAVEPAADVVEVVHGEWVHIKDYGGGKCSGHCSVCWTLQEADNPSALKGSFRYCRWCGAKMDGENSA